MASSIFATFIFAVQIFLAFGKCWEEPELLPFGVAAGDTEFGALPRGCVRLDYQLGTITFLGANNDLICTERHISAFYFADGDQHLTPTGNSCTRKFDAYTIMPFLNYIKEGQKDGGSVSYRLTYDSAVLANLQSKLSPIFPDRPGPDFFKMKLTWAYIITWSNKTLKQHHNNPDSCKSRNTVQAILIGGEKQTFSIFKYKQLEWTSLTDGCKGFPGTTPVLSTVGFMSKNAGYVKYLPGSCSMDAYKLAETSNVGIPGEWIYRVDGKSVIQKNFFA